VERAGRLALEEEEEAARRLVGGLAEPQHERRPRGGRRVGEAVEGDGEGLERREPDEGREVLDDEAVGAVLAGEGGEVVEGAGEAGVVEGGERRGGRGGEQLRAALPVGAGEVEPRLGGGGE